MRKGLGEGVSGEDEVKWINKMSEHWNKRVGSSMIKCAERECQNGERGSVRILGTRQLSLSYWHRFQSILSTVRAKISLVQQF